MSGFWLGVVSSIFGAVVVLLAQYLYRRRNEKRSPYTGLWVNKIYDENDNVIKRDMVHLRQKNRQITGVIRRIYPLDQTHRQWILSGRMQGRNMFSIFWSDDQSIHSYGCYFIRQKNDFSFEGYYLKMSKTPPYKIESIRVDLEREPSKQR